VSKSCVGWRHGATRTLALIVYRLIGLAELRMQCSNVELLQRDLDLLRNWNAARMAEFTEKRA